MITSLGFLLICIYGVYEGRIQPQPMRLLFGELILIGTAISIYVVWKILSIHRRKLLSSVWGLIQKMSNSESQVISSGALRKWTVTLSAIVFSFCCPIITVMCLFLPDRSTRPVLGSLFYLFGAFIFYAICFSKHSHGITLSFRASRWNGSASSRDHIHIQWITCNGNLGCYRLEKLGHHLKAEFQNRRLSWLQ